MLSRAWQVGTAGPRAGFSAGRGEAVGGAGRRAEAPLGGSGHQSEGETNLTSRLGGQQGLEFSLSLGGACLCNLNIRCRAKWKRRPLFAKRAGWGCRP